MQKVKYHRFDVKREIDGSWTVFDVFTGMSVMFAGRAMRGLEGEISRQLVNMLNDRDVLRRASLGS
ncbi:hypothetical protein [Rhizobium tubonense]|uniref:Uncharacterized protein n=1 Tax=Rhizobium tubonense TaxID=484088 RepID=A0A2W4CQW9_9HYPH|nr:hypothetical protein [Rhizobium tubonense]PZM15012.1 hypothetical protein CPY51_08150 [Rhizobium tubonense]